MQHGTGRELVTDLVENVEAALVRERDRGRPVGDLIVSLREALGVLAEPADLDARGLFGPDYPTPKADEEARTFRDGPFQVPNPVGRIRPYNDGLEA